MRSAKQVFSKQHNTSSRRVLQDYDYLDQLSDQDKDWLARFTDNYYSASFDLNPGFVRTNELLGLIEAKLARTKTESGIKKWSKKLELVKNHTKKFYQVSENSDKNRNIDLRIIKKLNGINVDIFYKTESGGYSASKYYKYCQNNVIDATRDLDLKACNDRSNHQSECVMGKFGANNIDDYEIDMEQFGPEDYMILNESAMEVERMVELGILKE